MLGGGGDVKCYYINARKAAIIANVEVLGYLRTWSKSKIINQF